MRWVANATHSPVSSSKRIRLSLECGSRSRWSSNDRSARPDTYGSESSK